MLAAAVITTFPNDSWNIYSKAMLESFVANWPAEIPILVQLDDKTLAPEVNKILRESDGLECGWKKDHKEFVERNKGKDDPQDYRKQAVRFCHKVFAIKHALNSISAAKEAKEEGIPRHLIWLDADVLTTRKVTVEDIEKCLPKEGDAVSYMGRKDWPHSECGWLAFDLENSGELVINTVYQSYVNDQVFNGKEWHDSWVFDEVRKYFTETNQAGQWTNLTPNAAGMEVWPQSPMASWSRHYKGPIAKAELARPKDNMKPLQIQTKNSIPDESIVKNIVANQAQIKNWIRPCRISDEEIVVVSAGPMLIPEDLYEEVKAGRKIVAVKHALKPLREAGIKPWACILLDPRDHVYDFVDNPDRDIIWLVASQVIPEAVAKLLDHGCNVWGYHASVGANEAVHTNRQAFSVVDGGSATSTRGLFLLDKLGFRKFRLYGYDLCFTKKPDLGAKDQLGQPVNFEVEIGYQTNMCKDTRWFWSKGELLAQANEFRQIMELNKWDIKAFGNGIVPFLYNVKRVSDLRMKMKLDKLGAVKQVSYEELFGCKTPLLTLWRSMLPKVLRKRTKASSY